MITTQHSAAGDLRVLAATLEIAAEVGRMGCYTREINQLTLATGSDTLLRPKSTIPGMASKVFEMLHQALGAFSRRDLALARSIAAQDDEVDGLYERANEAVPTLKRDAENWSQYFQLLKAAHYLERMSDRVTNICQWVIYLITGQVQQLNQPAWRICCRPV